MWAGLESGSDIACGGIGSSFDKISAENACPRHPQTGESGWTGERRWREDGMDSEPERHVRVRRNGRQAVCAYVRRNLIVVMVQVGVSVSQLSKQSVSQE